jgi:hypothetical protein
MEGSDAIQLRRQIERALRVDSHIDAFALPDQIVVMRLLESGRARKIDRAALRLAVGNERP